MLCFRIVLEPDDNETILVTSPDIPIVTHGDDRETALRHALDAIEALIASMMDAREAVPLPSSSLEENGSFVRLSLQTELKVRLHEAMREAGLTRADLQRKLGWQRESIDRLFRLSHNSRIEQLDQAFRALGRAIDIDVRRAA